MERVTMTGRAEQAGESFEFKIGPWAHGIGLMVRRTDEGTTTETGAGIWPTAEKAQSIADEIVFRTFGKHGRIEWSEPSR